MTEHCSIDIETFSVVNLKQTGVYKYAEHPLTSLNTLCYRFGHRGPVHIWIPFPCPRSARPLPKQMDKGGVVHIGPDVPEDLLAHVTAGKQLRAWNAMFERVVLNGLPRAVGFPRTPVEQWSCTMAKAQAASLPAALGHCATVCGSHPKDESGKQSMLQLAKPRKPSKNDPDDRWFIAKHPEKWRQLFHYCMDDVRAESALDSYIPDLRKKELKAYHLDQKINDRGLRVDLGGLKNAIFLLAEYKDILSAKCKELCGFTPGQTQKLGEWVRARFDIENLQAPTILEALSNSACPPEVRRVLKVCSTFGMKAPTKFIAMLRAACIDQRLHGMFQFHGASTGRWSSRIVQLQNLFRPVIDDAAVAIEAFKIRSLDWISSLWPKNPMKVLASCVRGMIIASTDSRLMCLDYASIEARVIAWLAGAEELLEAFRDGVDIYVLTAAKIYGIDPSEVTKDQRFIGKIAVLSLGYQGGWRAFVKMAKQHGVEMDRVFADKIKTDWRAANKRIVTLWYNMEEASCAAVQHPGKMFYVGKLKRIVFKVQGDWLYMRLPSGRNLAYYKPGLDGEGKVTFQGIDTYTRRWTRCKTYGGKLTENAVQAIARDLLLHGMMNLEKHGYTINGTVHDEVIMDLPNSFGTIEEASALMCELPDWADGIPVEAEGFEAQRYRK